jgi:hypothetical protein
VVGLHPGGQVGVEERATQAGRVAVHPPVAGGGDLGPQLRVTGDDPGEVHHLGHADGPVVGQQVGHPGGIHLGPRALER